MDRAVDVVRLLGRVDPDACMASVEQYVMDKDLTSAFFILDAVATNCPTVFLRILAHEEWLARARTPHGSRFEDVLEACREQRWQTDVMDARLRITDLDHRFLLGLLLNVPDRDNILRLVGEWSGRDPIEAVVDWVEAMATIDPDGVIELPGFRAACGPFVQAVARGHPHRVSGSPGGTAHRARVAGVVSRCCLRSNMPTLSGRFGTAC